MKIIDLKTKEVYYDDKKDDGLEFAVTQKFWTRLKRTGIPYRTGKKEGEVYYTEEKVLKLKDPSFKKTFEQIALSGIGEMVMKGKLPLNTVL